MRTLKDSHYRMHRMMGIPCQIVKPGAGVWLTGWKAESGRTGREQAPEPAMNSLIPMMMLLAIIAWAEGSLIVKDLPYVGFATVHRGVN